MPLLNAFCLFPDGARSDTHLRAAPTDNVIVAEDGTLPDHVGAHNTPGVDPDRPSKVNQDRHFCFQHNDYTVLCVMDGHGLKGHKLTEYLKSTELPKWIKTCLDGDLSEENQKIVDDQLEKYRELGQATPDDLQENKLDDVGRSLTKSFILSHYHACQNPSIPAGRSGTTCIVCVVSSDYIHTASTGDSTAILGSVTAVDLATESLVLQVQSVSTRTTVDMKTERARIDKGEGRIVAGNVFYGPVGIAMTRALGDAVMLRAGVLPVPVVTKVSRPLAKDDVLNLLIMGSDGVFDVMNEERVLQLAGQTILEHECSQRASEEVAKQAEKEWLADLPIETKVDDITCLVIKL